MNFGEHPEFLDFHVMKLPKYDAILGKSQLDKWTPNIDQRTNMVKIKVAKNCGIQWNLREARKRKDLQYVQEEN